MIAAEDDRRLHIAALHQVVEPHAGQVPLAISEPADAGRQALEMDLLPGHADPAGKRLVLREEIEYRRVGSGDVGRVAREGSPPERAPALTEQRPDVCRHEARKRERAGISGEFRLAADRVAVVEDFGTRVHEAHHGLHVLGHGLRAP